MKSRLRNQRAGQESTKDVAQVGPQGLPPKKNAENLERCTIVVSCAPTVITRTPMTIMKVLLLGTQKNL